MPNTTNDAAELGTAVHECSEFALTWGVDCSELVGLSFNGIKITEGMAYAGQQYVTYVNKILEQRPNAKLLIEKRVALSSIDAGNLWGTSDCIIIDGDTLIVGDYKNGYGVVEVNGPQYVYAHGVEINGNAQAIGYALSALDTYELWDKIKHVVIFIAQPNVEHIDGVVRYKVIDMDFMRQWWKIYQDTHALSVRDDAPTNAGAWCKYCSARGFCATRIKYQMQLLSLDKSITECDAEQLASIFYEIDVIKYTLDAVQDQVVKLARAGKKIPGKKLVKGIVRATCTDENALINEALNAGVDEDDLYNKRIKGKTAMVKLVGKDIANKYYKTPDAGLTLVNMSDKRPAVMADQRPDARGVFDKV